MRPRYYSYGAGEPDGRILLLEAGAGSYIIASEPDEDLGPQHRAADLEIEPDPTAFIWFRALAGERKWSRHRTR